MSAPTVSVVIASKDRRELLARVLDVLAPQLAAYEGDAEVVVVDDGSTPPYASSEFPHVRLCRTRGVGPARARNVGIAAATGEIVCFTDDDVVPADNWLATAVAYLVAHPGDAGVTGHTTAGAHDPLYEHAVSDLVGGSFLTCNVAYRRRALVAVGGFDARFTRAHEDRDLAWRVIDAVGPVGVEPAMAVTHPGRPFTVAAARRRARFIFDDWTLFLRHPERRAGRRSVRWTPVANTVRTWRNVARDRRPWRSPRDAARFVAVAGSQVLASAWLATTRWRSHRDLDPTPTPGLDRPGRRIAYLGPSPDPRAGGAPGVAGQLLGELLARGCRVDCFVAASVEDDDPRALGAREGLDYVVAPSPFRFGRWYSRHRLTKMVSSQVVAALTRRRLARALVARHERAPYDVVYQFSTFESIGVPRRPDLPVVIHPSVHAAGERRWVRAEAPLHLSDDSRLRVAAVSAWLGLRARRQRRDAQRATGILALSAHFAEAIVADYGVDPDRVRVVPNCVVVDPPEGAVAEPRTVVSVGRLVVRKGLEDVAALSHRLGEVATDLRIDVIGAPSLWSDYRRALAFADPAHLRALGPLARAEVFAHVASALALVQLSRYEPFGLTVAEALALGVPVIVTPEVGAAEEVHPDVKVVVPAGDIDALVAAVGSLAALRSDERALLAARCRRESDRLFAPPVVADRLLAALDDLLS